MRKDQRSTCPISTALEIVGDRWTLLIIRDMMFAGKRHFREFLQSEESISSNILADRLASLINKEILRKDGDLTHSQKAIYSLTEKGIQLLPVIAALSAWSQQYFPETRIPEAAKLIEGGATALRQIQKQLREIHNVS